MTIASVKDVTITDEVGPGVKIHVGGRWHNGPTIHHALCAALDAVIQEQGK